MSETAPAKKIRSNVDSTATSNPVERATATVAPHAHWLLRAAAASIFLFHGIDKMDDPRGFASMMNLPAASGIWIALAETAAGALLLVGGSRSLVGDYATRGAGALMAGVMIGAIVGVHWPQWSFVASDARPMGGMEFQVALALLGLFFVVRGRNA